jgi:hypothetical protein
MNNGLAYTYLYMDFIYIIFAKMRVQNGNVASFKVLIYIYVITSSWLGFIAADGHWNGNIGFAVEIINVYLKICDCIVIVITNMCILMVMCILITNMCILITKTLIHNSKDPHTACA